MQSEAEGVPRRGAFTLVEVVLALAVAGLVMATVHRLLAVSYRQSEHITRAQSRRQAMATLGEILRADLTAFCPLGTGGRPIELRIRSAVAGAPQELTFTTAGPRLWPAPQQEPLARRVTYRMVASPTGAGGGERQLLGRTGHRRPDAK
ncbi:MAG: prepilin-type N-terminal cleavage/methylation domain-containing protein, partial [Ectothiorhodospiraceae bacterium]